MDGNPLVHEQLVSFAGAEAQGTKFPVEMAVENNMPRRWSWANTFVGKAVMAYYAFDAEPDTPLVFNFTNSSYAKITPVGAVFSGFFGFEKINEDEWDRPDANYTLRRVVNADGSAGPFLQNLSDWYPHMEFLGWSSDNGCV